MHIPFGCPYGIVNWSTGILNYCRTKLPKWIKLSILLITYRQNAKFCAVNKLIIPVDYDLDCLLPRSLHNAPLQVHLSFRGIVNAILRGNIRDSAIMHCRNLKSLSYRRSLPRKALENLLLRPLKDVNTLNFSCCRMWIVDFFFPISILSPLFAYSNAMFILSTFRDRIEQFICSSCNFTLSWNSR